MQFTRSIAAKIYGLAGFLLLLTIVLSAYMLFEARQTEREMNAVLTLHMPLADSITKVNEYGLRRRLAFERWFGALNSNRPNAEVIAEASANYAAFTAKLNGEFAVAQRLIDAFPPDLPGSERIEETGTALQHIAATYPAMNARQRQVLDLQLAGANERANELLNVLNDQQSAVLGQREALRVGVDAMVMAVADDISRRQRQVLWLTLMATASAVLLGLLVAAIITGRLIRPMRSLMTAMHQVQGGDLERQIPVQSRDEVGELTQSFNELIKELRDKEKLRRTFGKYIDPRVLEQVMLEPDAGGIAGERRVMTVLFADLVGFTGLSERLTPSRMVALLNRHFGLQAQAVHDHRGIVDKFIGDALMAFWGPPFVPDDVHAVSACRAALSQRDALATLRGEIAEITGLRTGAPEIDLRIGICSGEVVVGNIGSEKIRSYTVIGDTVNLASRIEGTNRIYGTHILIGEETARMLDSSFELREIDLINVKGKSEPARIFELLGDHDAVAVDVLRLRDDYALALAAYRNRDWDTAERMFGGCIRLRPQDRASMLMLERTGMLRINPPPADWAGVWHMEEK
ncbi:MAG: adenylate/guanylate cyclase domain-containing protein [Betaproteobacteria bacterium]